MPEGTNVVVAPRPIDKLVNEIETKVAERVKEVLPPNVSPERFIRVLLNAVMANPDLVEADRTSFYLAGLRCASDGLVPDGREATLTTRYGRRAGRLLVSYQPMVTGVIKRVKESAGVVSLTAQVAYEGEQFQVVLGDEERIIHIRDLDAPGNRDIIAAYCIFTLADGSKQREVMTRRQIDDVRAKAVGGGKSGPWSDWYDQMAIKSVVHRCAKRLPSLDTVLRRVVERVEGEYDLGKKSIDAEDEKLQAAARDIADADPEPMSEAKPTADARIYYVAAIGRLYDCPDVATWRGDWLKRIRALVTTNRLDELREAANRNEAAIKEVGLVAPLSADEVRNAIRDALTEAPAASAAEDRPLYCYISSSNKPPEVFPNREAFEQAWANRVRDVENDRDQTPDQKVNTLREMMQANIPVVQALRAAGEKGNADAKEAATAPARIAGSAAARIGQAANEER
jgi:recombination protein RecT